MLLSVDGIIIGKRMDFTSTDINGSNDNEHGDEVLHVVDLDDGVEPIVGVAEGHICVALSSSTSSPRSPPSGASKCESMHLPNE